MSLPSEIELGTVTCPSGILVILDPGYMRFWSGRSSPLPPVEEFDNPTTRATVASTADYIIVGRDAEKVARLADIQSFHFIYDMPSQGAETWGRKIATLAAEHGFDARLEREPQRIPHRERAQRAADLGGGDFVMDGPWVAVVGGLPSGPFRVYGRRRDFGGNVGLRWADVWVQVSRSPVASSLQVGYFGVDYGLALIADVDAIEAWEHRRPLDGLFDVAFWGRDVERAAQDLSADQLTDARGWRSIPEGEARRRYNEVRSWLDASSDRKLAVEVRPHSHYYWLLEPIRQSAFRSGEIELSGVRVLGLSTSWGDGIFAVFVDRDADGHVAQIRLELGNENRRQLAEKVWAQAADH